jgi:N-terminal domain on NACHT_NTPase and P-loop NTPases
MAELLAAGTALGVTASLITFGDVAWRVLKRLKQYNDRTDDAPAVIKHISAQLPILIEKMAELKLATENGSLSINPQTALAVAVTGCDELIKRLDVVTKKLLPNETDSRPTRVKKAFSSIYYEKEVSKAWGEIESYKTSLIFHFAKMTRPVQELESPRSKKPIFMVPFERDLKFVGRVEIIADIRQTLQRRSRVAIAGLGGVG